MEGEVPAAVLFMVVKDGAEIRVIPEWEVSYWQAFYSAPDTVTSVALKDFYKKANTQKNKF